MRVCIKLMDVEERHESSSFQARKILVHYYFDGVHKENANTESISGVQLSRKRRNRREEGKNEG